MDKNKLSSVEIVQIKEEVLVLRTLDHPNIIKYFETYENDRYLYIVMEYCSGGELFEMITKKTKEDGCFTEIEASEIMENLFRAISHCHAHKIAHRDIKPENIMIDAYGHVFLCNLSSPHNRGQCN